MTDDALNVYKSAAGKVEFLASVSWKESLFEDIVSGLLQKDCGRKPVVVLNDMVEQHYRKERLPKVGAMDKAQVLQRRLQIAFPSYPVRAALPSKVKASALPKGDAAGPQGDLYLFAAVPASEALAKTLGAVRRSLVSIGGFALLPVESADMVAALAKKLGGEEKSKTHWSVFIGHHQNGGLRQIITRNGELALTRMTAIGDTSADSGVWARDVANEFKATMSYLSRFGYGANDILDVIIVSDPSSANHLKAMIETPCRLHLLTPQEAAQAMGIKLAKQDSQRYSDGLHAAWTGKKPSLVLPMSASQIDAISKPRQAAMAAMIALVGAFGFMAFQIFLGSQAVLATNAKIHEKQGILNKVEQEYQAEIARKEALGINVLLIKNSLDTYAELDASSVRPLPILNVIGKGLGNALKVDAVKIIAPKEDAVSVGYVDPSVVTEKKPMEFQTFIQLSFKPNIPPEAAVNEVNKLQGRLKELLPSHRVEIIKQAFDMSTSTVFLGQAANISEEEAEKSDLTAEISIKGPAI